MMIAKTHRVSSRLIGMQLTLGNLIGLLLSMTQMSLGFVFLTSGMTKGNQLMIGMIALVGCALALLIERLSIGGLSGVREASEERKSVQDKFYARAERREPSSWQVENKDRQVTELNKRVRVSWTFGAGGMFLSTLIGDMFWERVFSSMGDWWKVIPMSLACACVIGITFVHSELFKTDLDHVIKGILRDLGVMKAAASVEEENMQLDMMVGAMETVRDDEERRVPIEDKIAKVVVKRLTGFADHFHELTLDETRVVEADKKPQLQLEAPKRRTQYQMHREELRQLLTSNPDLSLSEIGDHFGKSKATVQNWVEKLKVGL